MSALYSRFGKISSVVFLLVIGASGSFASDLTLQRVPPLTLEQVPTYPQNLARYDSGANLEMAQPKAVATLRLNSNTPDALLCNDPTVGYSLPAGTTTLLVSFPGIENIDSISFLNQGVRGKIRVSTANAKLSEDSPQWRKVSEQDLNSDSLKMKVGPAEAKYVQFKFDVEEPGRISSLGVYRTSMVSDFATQRPRKSVSTRSDSLALISYNVGGLRAAARALYVSSGQDLTQANNMIDDQPSTGFAFSATDAAPTAVVDLGRPTNLRRISTVFSPRRGSVDFYVLQSLPGITAGNSPQTLRLNEVTQANLKPVGTLSDDGTGRAAVEFPETTGRYVMVKWNSVSQDTSFSVAEIAAFGGASANLMAANASGTGGGLDESDGKTVMDGKDAKDFKDIPAEGPEPPAEGPPPPLPPPPPFVFVPELLPTSE